MTSTPARLFCFLKKQVCRMSFDDVAVLFPRIAQQMSFLMEIDKLKAIIRQSPIINENRKENDAEHSWHLATMALFLREYADDPDLDVFHAIKMILIHDIVEIDAGDTFVYDIAAHATKRRREELAAERIFNMLPDDQAVEIRDLWEEFELHQTPESRYANALDRLHPMMMNYMSGGRGWAAHGVTSAQVLDRNKSMQDGAPMLWDFAASCVDDAINEGFLPK
jgi:putative hydrolase of HD superfamily